MDTLSIALCNNTLTTERQKSNCATGPKHAITYPIHVCISLNIHAHIHIQIQYIHTSAHVYTYTQTQYTNLWIHTNLINLRAIKRNHLCIRIHIWLWYTHTCTCICTCIDTFILIERVLATKPLIQEYSNTVTIHIYEFIKSCLLRTKGRVSTTWRMCHYPDQFLFYKWQFLETG